MGLKFESFPSSSSEEMPPDNRMEHEPSLSFSYERYGDVSFEHEQLARAACERAAHELGREWEIDVPTSVPVSIMSDEAFREGARPGDPHAKKFCFLLRDQPDNRLYVNVEIFAQLPNDAERMIKHEVGHIAVGLAVGNMDAYRQSFLLEEGTAGLDNATETLASKLAKEQISEIPDPTDFDSLEHLKGLGGDTDKEPFSEQLGYLVLYSFVSSLKERHGNKKLVEVYRKLSEGMTLPDAYRDVCGEEYVAATSTWKHEISDKRDAMRLEMLSTISQEATMNETSVAETQ